MPDSKGRYNAAGRAAYRSPSCPECGGPTRQSWVDASDLSDPPGERWEIPGTYTCLDPSKHRQAD